MCRGQLVAPLCVCVYVCVTVCATVYVYTQYNTCMYAHAFEHTLSSRVHYIYVHSGIHAVHSIRHHDCFSYTKTLYCGNACKC